jgi:hypothetical protein
MKNHINSKIDMKDCWLKALYILLIEASLVLFFFAARLPSYAENLNTVYWLAHHQPYFWRLLTGGESNVLGMGLQALVVAAVYGILAQALPHTPPFYQWLRMVLGEGRCFPFCSGPFWCWL